MHSGTFGARGIVALAVMVAIVATTRASAAQQAAPADNKAAAPAPPAAAVKNAEDPAQPAAVQDPPFQFPSTWIGGTPPSLEALRGKAVLFYFFEETCPRCRGLWPQMMALAQQHEDDPIAFVAVNSGTPPAAVSAYARGVRLNWPVIVDLDRSFEMACNVGTISLQNIMQVRYLSPKGELKRGNWNDLEGTISRALEGAEWKVDPADVPPELRLAWRSIEFARYADAAASVKQGLSSRKREIKAAAQKLADVVDEQAQKELDAAKAETSKFRASEMYAAIAEKFNGYAAAQEASAAYRDLSKDPELRKELARVKLIDRQRALLNSTRPATRERAAAAIQKIIDDQPDSEAARIGRELIGQK